MSLLARTTPAREPQLAQSPLSDRSVQSDSPRFPRHGFLEACSNPGCGSGWLHVWRSRTAPLIEGGWTCSAVCTAERLKAALARELDGRGPEVERHRHRVPLGLLMLEQGWITAPQLRRALENQRQHASGRLGQWLVAQEGVDEQFVTRALGLQWSCPVLPIEPHDPSSLSPLLPRLFLDAFGALPLRIAAGKLIYLGFEDRLDAVLSLALERMSGLRVETGLVRGSLFQPAHARMLQATFPPVELLDAASESALVTALTRRIERERPAESRLVRVHDFLWLRMWGSPAGWLRSGGLLRSGCALHHCQPLARQQPIDARDVSSGCKPGRAFRPRFRNAGSIQALPRNSR